LITIESPPFAERIFPAVAGNIDHVYVALLSKGVGIEYVIVLFIQTVGLLAVTTGNGNTGQVTTFFVNET